MILDWSEYTSTARQAAAEGCVLLKNDGGVLPLKRGSRVAVFGRIQCHYYKSGTGSGGMVNVSRTVGILDALLEEPDIVVDRELLAVYEAWEKANPVDEGDGWAKEPWSQEEMPVSPELAQEFSGRNDVALVVIGRTAGEDRDNADERGAYQLSDTEAAMIAAVRSCFDRVAVLFNIGSVMDMSHPCLEACDALMCVWQGGMVGGYGVADVLTGRVNPSGRLADTVARDIKDYPSTENFGGETKNYYREDIYVGYRYFETAARERVLYPFGYGLSYSEFELSAAGFEERAGEFELTVEVKNMGRAAGKEVVQVYVEAPQGELGKPLRVLAGFAKTGCLEPGGCEDVKFTVSPYDYASYDDCGMTGHPYCYVLEEGTYRVYAGKNVRDAACVGMFTIDDIQVVKELSQMLAPEEAFERMRPVAVEGETVCCRGDIPAGDMPAGQMKMGLEPVPTGNRAEAAKRREKLPEEFPFTGDAGYRLGDVASGRVSMEQFIAQLDDEALSCIIRGEGMDSPKVTPGTAAAYGGVSETLTRLGIPCACCSDGPSGMRMDSGAKAFSLPNGTLLACTFNQPLVQRLYAFTGMEMVANRIDNLLGPGMNIHRNPLNGRNFEYFSEDPYLTGKMAAAQLRGLKSAGVTGTVKHFAANNQEKKRTEIDSVVSERALREIYLKGFEIAVREGGADSVMTTYGALNGVWTAGRFELCTSVLRDEWGFSGIVMTDWWAKISRQGQSESGTTDFAAMAMAQNDLYMVCEEADKNGTGDNTLAELENGILTRGELQRNAMNICRQIMTLPAFRRSIGKQEDVEIINRPPEDAQPGADRRL